MITLYSTVGCHLCEQAQVIIEQAVPQTHAVRIIDIALDEVLFERFGTSIPVVEFDDRSLLYWPFSAADFQAQLTAQAS